MATYNIHQCVGSDGRRDSKRTGEVLRQLQADVIGLQEVSKSSQTSVDSDQLDYLAQLTGLRGIAGPTIQRADGHFGNALLSRFPPAAVRHHDLSIAGREPRGLLDVELGLGSQTARVLVTHFGHDRAQRNFQSDKVLSILSSQDQNLVVLLGDFNEWLPWSRPLRRLRARLGKAPWHATYPARFPLLALDRIWVWPPGRVVHVEKHSNPMTRVASDHLPLRAVVLFSS